MNKLNSLSDNLLQALRSRQDVLNALPEILRHPTCHPAHPPQARDGRPRPTAL